MSCNIDFNVRQIIMAYNFVYWLILNFFNVVTTPHSRRSDHGHVQRPFHNSDMTNMTT